VTRRTDRQRNCEGFQKCIFTLWLECGGDDDDDDDDDDDNNNNSDNNVKF
jgi:hypothetical protein